MYDDLHAAPRGLFNVGSGTPLTNAAQAIGTAGLAQRVLGGNVAVNGAVGRVIIFRASGAGAEYFRLPIPANTLANNVQVPAFYAAAGLEVLTTAAAADLLGVITFWKST
jgi:hypothetical protein